MDFSKLLIWQINNKVWAVRVCIGIFLGGYISIKVSDGIIFLENFAFINILPGFPCKQRLNFPQLFPLIGKQPGRVTIGRELVSFFYF